MALQAGSPAIGAGVAADFPARETPITTDQTGATLNTPPDLGAIQYAVGDADGDDQHGHARPGDDDDGARPARPRAYTVSGSGLTTDILITAPTGVELSDDGGTTWGQGAST